MPSQNYITVPILSIIVPAERTRALDKNWAQALAAMFIDHGNKTAIEVRKVDNGEGYILVSGLHRLEAAKIAGWNDMTVKLIEASSDNAVAEYKLHEVMENIGRQELTILDRANHLFEFMRVMEMLHPMIKKGGDKQTDEAREKLNEIFSLRSDVANSVGLSQRSIQMSVKLWKSLSKATRERVDGTWLANHQAGLMSLAAVGDKQQSKILDVVFDPEKEPKSVADAIVYLEQGRLATAAERQFGNLRKTFEKLPDDTFDTLLDLNAARVEKWLDRRGAK